MFFTIWRDALLDDSKFLAIFICVALGFLAFYLKMARQKTAYHYQIYEDHATLDHQVYYSTLETGIIKTVAVICMLAFVGVALFTGSLLFLVGPAAIGFLAALRLMNWQNPVTHEDSLPWHEYNFVTVDRKRRVIVTHRTDITLGFEARLPDDELFEKYLAILRTSLPPTAEFMEKKWDLDLL
ncbi:permease [Pseudomonas sp. v388]|uniref:permease n=1 Tax=Pseudomonas sp. v388 TaxID=2479849 RepID=UPI000F7A6F80|nr:permease [Pseudomonas sp. v388]RRV05313.1 permease [Pseudomonas sp. v388]